MLIYTRKGKNIRVGFTIPLMEWSVNGISHSKRI